MEQVTTNKKKHNAFFVLVVVTFAPCEKWHIEIRDNHGNCNKMKKNVTTIK